MKYLIALGLAALFLGCGSPDRWQSHGDRVLGIGIDWAEDPVSGAVVPKQEAVKRDYKGTIYYFESTKTAATFDRHPEEFALPEDVLQVR